VHGQRQEGFRHVLLDVAGLEAAAAGEVAGGGFVLAGEDAEQGGLAGAVGGDEADALAGLDGEVEAGEEGARGGSDAPVGPPRNVVLRGLAGAAGAVLRVCGHAALLRLG
jgi:hypothetical protein